MHDKAPAMVPIAEAVNIPVNTFGFGFFPRKCAKTLTPANEDKRKKSNE